MAPVDQSQFAAFLSYAHHDDEHPKPGYITALCRLISNEVQAQTGQRFSIFQDRKDISWGTQWKGRIEQALDATTLLIAIVSPQFLGSIECRNEFMRFAQRERDLGRNDLILPIYYIDCHSLAAVDPHSPDFEVERIIKSRQWIDWRDLRFEPLDSSVTHRAVARIASQIRNAAFRTKEIRTNPGDCTSPLTRETRESGPVLRAINRGSFFMGSDDPLTRIRECPSHYVGLAVDFRLARTPVTVRQFEDFILATGYKTTAERKDTPVKTWRNPGFIQESDHPVVCVSWYDAFEYCDWMSEKSGSRYRLPTEAEWEFACRAGAETRWFFGNSTKDLEQYAWIKSNSKERTQPVAMKNPNAKRLYDMLGNVWEWCSDWFSLYGNQQDTVDPKGPSQGIYRVARGGSWVDSPHHATSSYRCRIKPFQHANNLGFRVAADY